MLKFSRWLSNILWALVSLCQKMEKCLFLIWRSFCTVFTEPENDEWNIHRKEVNTFQSSGLGCALFSCMLSFTFDAKGDRWIYALLICFIWPADLVACSTATSPGWKAEQCLIFYFTYRRSARGTCRTRVLCQRSPGTRVLSVRTRVPAARWLGTRVVERFEKGGKWKTGVLAKHSLKDGQSGQ